jgi:hypothetical protein
VGLQRFPLSGFHGGVNTRSGPFDLEPNEAQDALNCTLTQRGALQQRAGKTLFATIVAAKRAENLRAWYTPAGVKWLMASIDGSVYSISSGGVATLRKAGTAGTVWVFEQAQDASGNDRLWMANGVDTPQKWDGVAGSTSNWVIAPGGVNPYFLRLWKNRMVIAGVNSQRLWFSAISDPETFAVTDWADIKSTSDDLDPLTWVELLGDALIVFKRRSTWEVYRRGDLR